MVQQKLRGAIALLLWVVRTQDVDAFQLKQQTLFVPKPQNRISQNGRNSHTELYGLFGQLRKNRNVEQVTTIKVGDTLPSDVAVERLLPVSDETNSGEQLSEPISIQEVLGPNKSLLVGRFSFTIKMIANSFPLTGNPHYMRH
jgi:hypothetical protein